MRKLFILFLFALSLAGCSQKESASIFDAAQKGDLESVRKFISSGINIDIQNSDGETAAHIAARNGNLDVLQYLLENNANIYMRGKNDETLLDIAKNGGIPEEITDCILSYNAEYDEGEYDDPIYNAVKEENIGILTDYINALSPEEQENSEIDDSANRRTSVLYHAMDLQKINIFEHFLKDTDINDSADPQGNTLLHAAAGRGHLGIVQYLVSRGANINAENRLGITPVITALENDFPEIIKFLKSKGANLNISVKEKDGSYSKEPVIFKYYYQRDNDYALLKRFIEAGADINIKGYGGETVLFSAAGGYGSNIELASYLIENNADVNAKNDDGQTPLFGAAAGFYDMAKLLIDKGAGINAEDKNLRTPLFEALNYNNNEVAQYLLAKGAEINHKDIRGDTPLHIAAGNDSVETVKLLVEKGAKVNAKNNAGHEPVYNASLLSAEGKAIIEYLESKGADPESSGMGGTFKLDFSM
ncbi:MAG: ankyrin repeat domain-containing protein [Endomicrobia bacterium]|nr:ankyrin repeat domain-containing protein [Endomicrobiia bacterium]